MRLSLCATSAARFWGLESRPVTFLHQNVLIAKKYIISLRRLSKRLPRFFTWSNTLYLAALAENRCLRKIG
jgi:hypothetical protein